MAFVKSDDGLEVHCNTSLPRCDFPSECGFTYFISVFAYNKAGQSPLGDVFNYTTGESHPRLVKGDPGPLHGAVKWITGYIAPLRATLGPRRESGSLLSHSFRARKFWLPGPKLNQNARVWSEKRGKNVVVQPRSEKWTPAPRCSALVLGVQGDATLMSQEFIPSPQTRKQMQRWYLAWRALQRDAWVQALS